MQLTRFMWFTFQAFMLFVAAFGLVACLELKRPEKDNTVLEALIFGFASTNAAILWTKAAAEKKQEATAAKTQESLNKQDHVLDQVHEKVNGGTTKLVNSLKEEHEAAMTALRAEHSRERHKIDEDRQAKELQATVYQIEAKEKTDSVARLEAQVRDLVEKLARSQPAAVIAVPQVIKDPKTEENRP